MESHNQNYSQCLANFVMDIVYMMLSIFRHLGIMTQFSLIIYENLKITYQNSIHNYLFSTHTHIVQTLSVKNVPSKLRNILTDMCSYDFDELYCEIREIMSNIMFINIFFGLFTIYVLFTYNLYINMFKPLCIQC